MKPINISSLNAQLGALRLVYGGDATIHLDGKDNLQTKDSLVQTKGRLVATPTPEALVGFESSFAERLVKASEGTVLSEEQLTKLDIKGLITRRITDQSQEVSKEQQLFEIQNSELTISVAGFTIEKADMLVDAIIKKQQGGVQTPPLSSKPTTFKPTPPPPPQHLKPRRQPQPKVTIDPALANQPLPQRLSPPPVAPRTLPSAQFNPQQHAANVGVASGVTPKGIHAKAVSSPFVESHAGHFPYGKVGGAPTTPLPTLAHLQKIDLNSTDFKQQFLLYKASLDAAMEKAKVDGSLKSPKDNQNHFLPSKGVECRFQDVPGVASTAVGFNLNANIITVAGVNLGIATQYPLESQFTDHGNMLREGRAPVLVVLNPDNEINDQTKRMSRYFENPQLFTANSKVETKLIEGNDQSRISTTSGVWVSPAKTLPSTIVQSLGWQDQTGMGSEYLVRLTETINREYAQNLLRYRGSTAISDSQKALPVIHCRAGVGRTGTVLAAMAMAYLPKNISLTQIVMELRLSRSHAMVQSPGQHEMLVHMALAQGRLLT